MVDNEARLRELSGKALDGTMTDEELAELAQLSMAKRQAREERSALVAEVRDTLVRQGITIGELFSTKEIAAALPWAELSGRRVGRRVSRKSAANQSQAAVGTDGATRKPGTWVRQKKGVVLVEVNQDGLNGFPCRYCMGQSMPFYVPKGLKQLDDGQLEANLARYCTAEGRAYFATEVGQVELANLVNYIRTHKLKPPLKSRQK